MRGSRVLHSACPILEGAIEAAESPAIAVAMLVHYGELRAV